MRTAFTLLGVLGATAALAADPPTDSEKKTIDALARLGGKAAVDAGLHKDARVAVKFEALTDAAFAAVKRHPNVGAVAAFDGTKLTEKTYAALKDLPHLRKFVLSQSTQTVKTVAHLAECAELRVLALPSGRLSDAELAALKKLSRLESLDVSENPALTDKAMATVKELERLEFLYLSNTGVSDKGLFELKPLEGLRTVNATNTRVTADGARKFADEMPNLRVVRR